MISSLKGQAKISTRLSERIISKDQLFQVQYIIEGADKVSAFTLPVFADFKLIESYDSPSNLKIRAEDSTTHTYVCILSPRKAGRLSVPGAIALVDGMMLRAPVAYIQVNAQTATDQVTDQSLLLPEENIDQKISENFFLSADISKKICYVGEPIQAVYKAYSRLNAESQVLKRPAFTGFSVLEMADNYNSQPDVEQIKGISYYVHLIRKVQLFPLQEGDYELEEAEIGSVIHFRKLSDRKLPVQELKRLIDPSSARHVTTIPYRHSVELRSPPVTVSVKALPVEGKPQNFTGAVGNYSIRSAMDPGEYGRVLVTIEGWGNFPLLTTPVVSWPEGLTVTPGSINESTDPYEFPLSGSKTFSWTLSSRDTATYTIPPVHFSFFDPRAAKYISVQSDPLIFKASRQTPPVKFLPSPLPLPVSEKFPKQYYWFGLVVVLVTGWLIFQIFHSRFLAKKKKAEWVLLEKHTDQPDPFLVLEQAVSQQNKRRFFHEMERLIKSEAGIKIPGADLYSIQQLANSLDRAGLGKDVLDNLLYLLRECEWVRFTPGYEGPDIYESFRLFKENFPAMQAWKPS